MLLLLITLCNPEWKSKKNNLQDKDRNIEIETQNLIGGENRNLSRVYGRSYRYGNLIKKFKREGFQKTVVASGVIDEEGNDSG